LLDRPQFPTIGLARFASHPDSEVRRLVARDPQADPATVELMLSDPDETVRKTIAGSPDCRNPASSHYSITPN